MSEEQKMSGWSKELGTVLGIVLVGFSAATLATLLDKTPGVQRQTRLHADLSQKQPLSAPAMIASHTRGLEVGLIPSEQALRLMGATRANARYLRFAFAHPRSVQFSFEHQLTFDAYYLEYAQ